VIRNAHIVLAGNVKGSESHVNLGVNEWIIFLKRFVKKGVNYDHLYKI
jgi:hypothetical protein